MPRAPAPNSDLAQQMAHAFLVNDRVNQLLLEHLDPRTWRAQIPDQKTRTIADIFAHVHNIRRKWLRLSAPHLKMPAGLDRRKCTQKQTQKALAESGLRCSEMLADALGPSPKTKFMRDGWARPWPPSVAIFAYMITHEAHHRGQICILAHQLGYRLSGTVTSHMWAWERLYKECGFDLAISKTRVSKLTQQAKRPAEAGR